MKCDKCGKLLRFVETILSLDDKDIERYYCGNCNEYVEVISWYDPGLNLTLTEQKRCGPTLYFWRKLVAPLAWGVSFALEEIRELGLLSIIVPLFTVDYVMDLISRENDYEEEEVLK
ncbi:hypothetical protein J7K05_00815 [bacterium]|nr:hypothetical protein [bacterium]